MFKRALFYYDLARLQNEGWGTVYEYLDKHLFLKKKISKTKIKRILIAGLPEKYGYSLDFLMLAQELGVLCTVIDDRKDRIERTKEFVTGLALKNKLDLGLIKFIVSGNSIIPHDVDDHPLKYDLVLSCEAIQRYSDPQQLEILKKLAFVSDSVFIFMPNALHSGHARSGLATVDIKQISSWKKELGGEYSLEYGFIDFAPWSSGITGKRNLPGVLAGCNLIQRLMAFIIELWLGLVKYMPARFCVNNSHIIYAHISNRSCSKN
ncbi:MAG: hypothetical protein WDL87_08240 [Candidatus Omnitrophota bacterium]|jgi:hypothetical protein